MKTIRVTALLASALLCAVAVVHAEDYVPSAESTGRFTVSTARKQVRLDLQKAVQDEQREGLVRIGYHDNSFDLLRWALTSQGIELDLGRGPSWGRRAGLYHKYRVHWDEIGNLAVRARGRGKVDRVALPRLDFRFDTAGEARRFADALFVVSRAYSARDLESELRQFDEIAARYRESSAKPEFPEAARKFRVQAEAAVRDKAFEDASDLYDEALKIAPWWPEGRFNRGLILGELGEYNEATIEMKKYLMLVPDAPNARAAQDKIYEWEGKAGRSR